MIDTDPCSPVRSEARLTSGDPGVSRCFCPATSSRFIGRILTASGVAALRNPGPLSMMAMLTSATDAAAYRTVLRGIPESRVARRSNRGNE